MLLLLAVVHLQSEKLTEASGLVVSRTRKDIVWTHNDSGDGPFLYAFDLAGKARAIVRVTGADARDWEDLASGPFPGKRGAWLYAADIGDNKGKRKDVVVYALPEPPLGATASAPCIALRATYPDRPHNAETLFCDPRSGRLTLVTKEKDGVSLIFRFPARPGPKNVLEKVAEFRVPGFSPLVTGGSFRPDGGAIALVTYTNVIELKGPDFWTATPKVQFQPGLRQLEAVAYARDGKGLLLTSEGVNSPLARVKSAL